MIYKYDLGVPHTNTQNPIVVMTHGETIKKFLDVQMQGNHAVVWAEVEHNDNANSYFTVVSVWTGYEEPKDMEYIGTVQEGYTGLVYHYYVHNPNEVFDV